MKIGIVGLGLIGGCLGVDLKAAGHQIYGVARRIETCQQALDRDIVHCADVQLTSLADCDAVFICTPIATIVPTVMVLSKILKSTAVVTDVGSVKAAIVEPATRYWPLFVGGHPMSGKSEAGLEAAEAGLFQGNSYVITPIEQPLPPTNSEAIARVEQLATQLGSQIYRCSPTDHDRAVAWISHLPVMVSSGLIHSASSEPDGTVRKLAEKFASSGFRDTSRVGGGNPELGLMMAQYNRNEVLRSLKQYRQSIDHTIQALEAEDWQAIAKQLNETKIARARYVEPAVEPTTEQDAKQNYVAPSSITGS
ncbi:prephenate/arogenate dehydrogenase [cf. Phormidesmis sp. LEGE 11477]|uniref:prephenate/arogenate dehydrogenase n=1 Tax=cf. Phormidesmis sp. LEGE 11477 TaxID=1828680 RepID=UPI00187DF0B6|nr:prephenate/arogenate dehydrogenase [cf. Phormidesmis sp. LEGE 11477]MBE9060080.1 prephenate/arogenate dehydrogenase [cf. Phormidesmis sp. LEGE 11477]